MDAAQMSVKGNISYPFQGFGNGLDLLSKPDNIDPASCIDCMNVIYNDRGAIERRPGYDNLTGSGLTNRPASLEAFYTSSGTKQLLAGCGTRLEAINTSGEVVKSATGLTNAVWDFTRFGKPNAEVAYAGNGTDTLRKWSGSEWTAPTATVNGEAGKAMPRAGSLCVWPAAGNRLVATRFSTTTGGPNGATSSPDHVWFSDAGNPESWHTTGTEENQVQLMPGNGEAIQAAIAWKEFVFVFKETSFFVFTQQSTDSNGGPEFVYRPVEGGAGLVSPRAVCAHPSGVYFMSRNGVYRTEGQEAELVSSPVEPIWTGEASNYYRGGTLAAGSITNCAMTIHRDQLYLAFPTESANDRTLIYDPQRGWWSITDIPASCLATFRVGNSEELVFGYASGSNHIGRYAPKYTNDDGAAITSRWRSGWFDLDNPDVKVLRSAKIWGSGIVNFGIGFDFNEDAGEPEEMDLTETSSTHWNGEKWESSFWAGGAGLVQGYRGSSVKGTVFSVYLANNILDQDWSVHRIVHHLRSIMRPSAL